ncbi:MAG: CoB--CoM heterodisulfide reductase iron-sulfur subunit A family protein [Deltaproteobacteria bacterium]|nr:CoB--CoM heterodisulfide reductase iron-sulfur subunit A family protein [Deltaproteobacteria bacterium]
MSAAESSTRHSTLDARNSAGTAVYLCHCGRNIAATVDVEDVAESLAGRPGISVVRHYPYMCSRPGQELIRKDLREGRASRVLVGACSPRMHESTFRKALAAEGFNPYLLCHVNVREQCSWVHADRKQATAKALSLVAAGLDRVVLQEPLSASEAPVTPRALVVGGGPAGLSAARELAAMGLELTLVEANPRLGGRAAELGRSFREGGPVAPWLEELVAGVSSLERIEILLGSRLVCLSGSPGNLEAQVETPSGVLTRTVGSVILSTGYDLYRPDDSAEGRPELGYGADPRILTQEELEALLRSGDDELRIEGEPIRSAAFLQCVGSRDRTTRGSHCSRICCMVSVRQASQLRERDPKVEVHVLYMDLRAYARGAEEAYDAAGRKGVLFRRGNASEVFRRGHQRVVRFEDTLGGGTHELPVDLVVLACGARPRESAPELARLLKLSRSSDGFFLEAHPKLRPMETASDGIFLAGACQGPKSLDEAVASGRAAAMKAAIPLLKGRVDVDPVVAEIDTDRCAGCGLCISLCPAGAVALLDHLPRSFVNAALCKGCGACSAVCPSKAAGLRHYRFQQVSAEVAIVCGPLGGARAQAEG